MMRAALLASVVLLFGLAGPAPAATVVLDTGHTKARPGSLSASGRPEYLFNLALSNSVALHLDAAGVRVLRVAADGREVALSARAAGTQDADLFVSIHHDSIKQEWIDAGRRGEFAGFAVFASRKNPDLGRSESCARQVGQALLAAGERPSRYHALPIPGENRPFFDERLGAHHFDDLVVLKTSKSPAILVEAGVIANPAEEARLGGSAALQSLSRAIASGIMECLPTHDAAR